MFGYKIDPVVIWSRTSGALVSIAILFTIATDRRPDDTSIRTALAAGTIGLFAFFDLAINRPKCRPYSYYSSWTLPLLVISFLLTCTFSALWAGEPIRSLKIMMVAWALFIAWLALRNWAARQPLPQITALLRWICLSILIFSLLLLIEVATNQYIHDYFVNYMGMSMSIPNYYFVTESQIIVYEQFLCQHVATLCYLFWPTLLAIYFSFGRWRALWMCGFTLLTGYSIMYSINETAMLAFTLGAISFFAAFVLPRTTLVFTAAVFSIAVLAIVPLTYVAHDVLQLQFNPLIPPSGQSRLPIWYQVASHVGESPFFGHGILHLQALLHHGQGFIGQHAHSHNVFLQTWFEIGAFGSLLILLMGLVFLKQSYYSHNKFLCFYVAGFVTIITNLMTTAWELWVPWHLGLITIVSIFVTLLHPMLVCGSRYAPEDRQRQ